MTNASNRQQRANGRASRSAILDAAAQIAGERGYEGTSIKLVSQRSGLPASSIYWHFENKDALIAAVVDRSFTDWIDALTAVSPSPAETDPEVRFLGSLRDAGEQIAKYPDFLRLGLMLTLERRPNEPAARRRFQEAREETLGRLRKVYRIVFEELDEPAVDQLVTLTLAGTDGLFVASEAEGIDIADHFEILGHAILGAAHRFGWRNT